MDYETYQKTNGQEIYLLTSTGAFYNPFMLDMSKLTKVSNYRINGQVMLTKRGIALPGMRKLSTVKKMDNPNLKKDKKSVNTFERKIVPMQMSDIRHIK